MKFISVRRLAAFFQLEFSRVDDELIERLRISIDQHFQKSEVLTAFGQDFTQKELDFILNQVKETEIRVFHDRIENDHKLVEYLFSNGEVILPDEEIDLAKDHRSFKKYQEFLSTFLVPILIRKIDFYINDVDLIEIAKHLKFSSLLPIEKCIEIQKPVNSFLNQLLAQTKVSQDKELKEQLKLVYSSEFVEILNELDIYYYQDVLNYFSTAKLIVQRNDLSPMLLDRIKSSVAGLDLKEEDQSKVVTFINAKTFTSRSKTPRSKLDEIIKSPFFFIAVLVVLINFVFLYPNKSESPKNDSSTETTGLDGLSEKELKKVDSMLGYKSDSIVEKEILPPADGSSIIVIEEDSLD